MARVEAGSARLLGNRSAKRKRQQAGGQARSPTTQREAAVRGSR
jgi:hypothetical protein